MKVDFHGVKFMHDQSKDPLEPLLDEIKSLRLENEVLKRSIVDISDSVVRFLNESENINNERNSKASQMIAGLITIVKSYEKKNTDITDADRLDWMIKYNIIVDGDGFKFYCRGRDGWTLGGRYNSPKEAIDAAMRETKIASEKK
jgi:hypothetical protein